MEASSQDTKGNSSWLSAIGFRQQEIGLEDFLMEGGRMEDWGTFLLPVLHPSNHQHSHQVPSVDSHTN